MTACEVLSNGAAPIAAVRAELGVAKRVGHQFVQQVPKAEYAAALLARL
jgi:hypothetical protein